MGYQRRVTAAFKLRVALPGMPGVGDVLTAKVQSLRYLPDPRDRTREDLGGGIALDGGSAWPKRDAIVTLRRRTPADSWAVPARRCFSAI